MNFAPHHRVQRRAGFTLIELLVAMAIMAMLVTALLTFVYSMAEIWGRGGEKRLFEQHVNAVTRHVELLLRHAAWPRGGTAAQEPFSVEEVRPSGAPSGNLLTFDLLEGDRLLRWPDQPLPEVHCHLGVENNRGLMLYWRSQLEKTSTDDTPRAALVSPFVTGLEYEFSDSALSSWRKENILSKDSTGSWLLPDRLVLVFKHGTYEARREISLPDPSALGAF